MSNKVKKIDIKIEIRGDISDDRLNELIKFIDAQLMEDGDGEAWSSNFGYRILVNEEPW